MSRRKSPVQRQQSNFPLPDPIRKRLQVTADVLGQTQAKIVTDALQRYFDTMPADLRKHIDQTIAIRAKV